MKQLELDYSIEDTKAYPQQYSKDTTLPSFKFIDLFAGIGGFHLAMHELGGKCVFVSEIDSHARKTYIHNFSKVSPQLFKKNHFNEDIRNIVPDEIPDFDLLCAGFPCQPFSSVINEYVLKNLVAAIKKGKQTFYIPEFEIIQNAFGSIDKENEAKRTNGSTSADTGMMSSPTLTASGSMSALLLSSVLSAMVCKSLLGEHLLLSLKGSYVMQTPLLELPLYLVLGATTGIS